MGRYARHALHAFAVAVVGSLATPAAHAAHAAESDDAPLADDPYRRDREALAADLGWPAGSIQEQLDGDPTLVPFGKGALFVPAMTNRLDEPPVTIYRDGEKLAEATTGRRIVLAPGLYSVQLGSGALEQQFGYELAVTEGHTAVVPVFWSGLTIHIVDTQYSSIRGAYELVRMSDREYLGIGLGADEQAGEPVATWLVEPGLYKIVRAGDSYRARTDFATVRLEAGRHTHYLLVLDEETSSFKGAGEVTEAELFQAKDGFWWSTVVGGDVSLQTRRNVLGTTDGDSYTARGFLDARANIEIAHNPLVLQLQIEEGQTKPVQLPWQKTQDRADLDVLYVYSWLPWVGPYVRFGAETNLFAGLRPFDTPRDVALYDENGGFERTLRQVDEAQLSPPMGLWALKEGAGVNLRITKTVFAEATVRTGIGARHRMARGLYEEADDNSTPELDLRRVASTNLVGVEGTLVATARLTRYIIANLEADSLVPFDAPDQVVLDVSGTVTLKLTQYASLNYVARYARDPTLVGESRLEQDVALRFSVALP